MNTKGLKRITELSVEKADAVKGGVICVCSCSCSCVNKDLTDSTKGIARDGNKGSTDIAGQSKG